MAGQSMDPEVAVLVEQGLDLVPKVVASLSSQFPRHVERAELVRAGMVGLIEAAYRFDASRDVPFERFAATRIRGSVLDALRADDWVPRSLRSAARRIEVVESSLTARYGRKPTVAELSAESGTSPERVIEIRTLLARSAIAPLDRERSDDRGGLALALVAEDQPDVVDVLEREELLGYLRDGLNELPSRQQRIILGQFLEGRTTAELATELGVTRSRVSQLRTVALHELRRSISAHYSMPSPSVPSSSLSSSAGDRVDQAEVSVRSVASA